MSQILQGKKVLITAGPTREYIDPVRYITNESSGKMGHALAEEMDKLGAQVTLVCGPVSLKTNSSTIKLISVVSADEMYLECSHYFEEVSLAIFCAAVADYKPKSFSNEKIKKAPLNNLLVLEQNVDIAFEFGKQKKANQFSVGFALETNDIIENSKKKLNNKNFDLIVINSPAENQAFGFDTNKVSILNKENLLKTFKLKSKTEVAKDIIYEIGLNYGKN